MQCVKALIGLLTVVFVCGGCASTAEQTAKAEPAVRAPLPAADFYVATNGNDAWSGKLPDPNADGTDGPFATFVRARTAVRQLVAARLPLTGVTVLVRGGSYTFGETFTLDVQDKGSPGRPVTYRAYPGEIVQVSGGPTVPASAFRPVTDAAVRQRLDSAVSGQILEVDLDALGITELGSFPVRFQGAPKAPELFFNNERMKLACWPDEGWTTIEKIISAGSCPRKGDKGKEGGVFEYSGDRPKRWSVDAGVWLHGYYCFDWYEEVIKVKSIDTAVSQITMAAPAHYSIRRGNPSPRRYRAINLLEELTAPGEYYIDRNAKRLYFLPPADLSGARIVLSTLDGPAIRLQDTSYVVIRGFTVEATLADGIEVLDGTENRIQACEVRNTRGIGIRVDGGTRHKVEACDVHDTGTGGIRLAGGNRKTLERGDHEALNNHVWRFSQHKQTYSNAFSVGGVGQRVAHNLIHDAPHQAIAYSGNDCIFEYNIVHHICTETDDCGAFYKGRDPSRRGNVIRYNFWHNIGGPMGHGNAAVYFDDGDGGDFVFGNVFFRCGDPGKGSFGTVFSHGGHDILAENNIFIECKRSLGSAPWNFKRWASNMKGGTYQQRLLKDVDITKPPYTTHYPRLVDFFDPKPEDVRASVARNNVICMGADVRSGNWQVDDKQNWITSKDPGFVAPEKGDFRLKPGSKVYKLLPGFKPIPFEKMGLYTDELRPALPEDPWTYAPPKALPPLPARKKRAAQKPKPKTGPPPVFKVSRAQGTITVDGTIDPVEWGKPTAENAMLLAQDVGGHTVKRTSRAWLAYTEKGLYIAVDNTIHPDTKLDTNRWGADDAVEVGLRVLRKGTKKPPIAVIRGFGNGYLQFGPAQTGDDDPRFMEPSPIVYKAKRVSKKRWTAEFYIPYQMFECAPSTDKRVAFNLTVRKAKDDLWLMWEGTRAHSYDVDRAGFIEFAP